jgi:hypothetical protein
MMGRSGAGQESRSARGSAALTMTTMDLSIHATPLPHTGPEASLAFCRDVLGLPRCAGTFGWIMLATSDLDGTLERVQSSSAHMW